MKIRWFDNKTFRKCKAAAIVVAGVLVSLSMTAVGAEGQGIQTGESEAGGAQNTEMQVQQLKEIEPGMQANPQRFALPEEARVLVVVEGTGESKCQVYTWEKAEDGWKLKFIVDGNLGLNGMSNHRVMGDKTTPIGVDEHSLRAG